MSFRPPRSATSWPSPLRWWKNPCSCYLWLVAASIFSLVNPRMPCYCWVSCLSWSGLPYIRKAKLRKPLMLCVTFRAHVHWSSAKGSEFVSPAAKSYAETWSVFPKVTESLPMELLYGQEISLWMSRCWQESRSLSEKLQLRVNLQAWRWKNPAAMISPVYILAPW